MAIPVAYLNIKLAAAPSMLKGPLSVSWVGLRGALIPTVPLTAPIIGVLVLSHHHFHGHWFQDSILVITSFCAHDLISDCPKLSKRGEIAKSKNLKLTEEGVGERYCINLLHGGIIDEIRSIEEEHEHVNRFSCIQPLL